MRIYLRMSGKNKLRAKLASLASDKNWTLADAELILIQHGFVKRSGEGSHRIFSHASLDQPLVLAAHGKAIKSGYIRAIRQAIQDLPA